MNPRALLDALQQKKSLTVAIKESNAHKWGVPEIIANFLQPLVDDKTHAGIAPSCQGTVSDVCKDLITFLKRDKVKPPIQFTIAKVNTEQQPERLPKDSKHSDLSLPCPYPTKNSPGVTFVGQGIYDVLGWILSAFGPIRPSPDPVDYFETVFLEWLRHEFLQPLLVLYARWCNTIWSEGPSQKQRNALPAMAELAVRAVSRSTIYYALGAGVAGFPNQDADLVIQRRKDQMIGAKLLDITTAESNTPKFLGIPAFILTLSPDQIMNLILGNRKVKVGKDELEIWNPAMTKGKLQELLKQQEATLAAEQAAKLKAKEESEANTKERQKRIDDAQNAVNTSKSDLNKIAGWASTTNPIPLTFTGWREIYQFANRWLNKTTIERLIKNKQLGGSAYGNCAETYPLLMLSGNWYKTLESGYVDVDWFKSTRPIANGPRVIFRPKDTTGKELPPVPLEISAWGGLAIRPSQAAGLNFTETKEFMKQSTGPCLNCRRLIESFAVGGDKTSFFNGQETPFVIPADKLAWMAN